MTEKLNYKELFLELYEKEQKENGLQSMNFTHMSDFNFMVKTEDRVPTPTENEVYQDLYYILKNYGTGEFETILSVKPREIPTYRELVEGYIEDRRKNNGLLQFTTTLAISISDIDDEKSEEICEELWRSIQAQERGEHTPITEL